jgi:TonB family protein
MCEHLPVFWGSSSLVCTGLICTVRTAPQFARAVIRKVQPQYPALAQKMSIKGNVKVEVVVEADGSVKSLNTKGGHPVLAQAAQDAIREWKWQPASRETVESVEVRFSPQYRSS